MPKEGFCGHSSVVEHRPSKPRAAGSNPAARLRECGNRGIKIHTPCLDSSEVEHLLGKEVVVGSIPTPGF